MRDKKISLAIFWAITIISAYFSFVSDSVHVLILTTIFLLMSTSRKEAVKVTNRSIIYSFTGVLTFTVLFNQLFKIEDTQFFLTQAEFFFPMMIYTAVTLTFFEYKPRQILAIVTTLIFCMMLTGDTVQETTFKRLPFDAKMLHTHEARFSYYGYMLLAASPAVLYLIYRSIGKSIQVKSGNYQNTRRFIFVAATASAMIFTSIIYIKAIPVSKSMEQSYMNFFYQIRMKRSQKTRAFEDQTSLRHSMRNTNERQMHVILIRVHSEDTPGYLRAKSYKLYNNSKWEQGGKEGKSLEYIHNKSENLTYTTYKFKTTPAPIDDCTKMEILYSGNFFTDAILHAGNTEYMEVITEDLSMSESGQLVGTEFDKAGGITLYTKEPDQWSAYNSENNDLDDSMTIVPAEIRDEIIDYLAEHNLLYPTNDTRETIRNIVEHFEKNGFEYKLGVNFASKRDPVIDFLKDKKQGHCELFATSTVMLLRQLGIPARYVTGFHCTEKHPSKGYYVGRREDLHAWVEAYIPEEKKWVLVEPTPPSGLPDGDQKFSSFELWTESLSNWWDQIYSKIVRGHIADAILLSVRNLWAFIVRIFSSPITAIPALLLLIFLYRLVKFLRRHKTKQPAFTLSEIKTRLKTEVEKLFAKTAAKFKLEVNDSMTPYEILDALEKEAPEAAEKLRPVINSYIEVRYAKTDTETDKISEVLSSIKAVTV